MPPAEFAMGNLMPRMHKRILSYFACTIVQMGHTFQNPEHLSDHGRCVPPDCVGRSSDMGAVDASGRRTVAPSKTVVQGVHEASVRPTLGCCSR